MKIFIFHAFIFFFVFQSSAQQIDEKFYKHRVEKFKRIKNYGVGLTALGGVALLVGLAMTASDENDGQTFNSGYNQQSDDVKAGEVITVGSFFLLAPGIPLWIIGGKGESKYNQKQKAVSVRANMDFQQRGVALSYRF
jgi:hypothetical protein